MGFGVGLFGLVSVICLGAVMGLFWFGWWGFLGDNSPDLGMVMWRVASCLSGGMAIGWLSPVGACVGPWDCGGGYFWGPRGFALFRVALRFSLGVGLGLPWPEASYMGWAAVLGFLPCASCDFQLQPGSWCGTRNEIFGCKLGLRCGTRRHFSVQPGPGRAARRDFQLPSGARCGAPDTIFRSALGLGRGAEARFSARKCRSGRHRRPGCS